MNIHSEEYKGYTINIEQDYDSGFNPRYDHDNLTVMACFHKRYELGDKDHGIRSDDYRSWDEMEKAIVKVFNPVIILPMFMFDHSGLTVNTTGFACPWDSGQIGFVFVPKAKAYETYMTKRITPKIKETIKQITKGEVEDYDHYLRGNIFAFDIEDANGEHVESCCGYIGDYEDACLPDAKEMIDSLIEREKAEAEKNRLQLAIDA